MYRNQAIAVLHENPNAYVVATRDGTGDLWIDHGVALDEGGELVMVHPTDPAGPMVRAPESGRYRVVDRDPDWGAVCKEWS